MTSKERRARAMLEAWLRGLTEGGHAPPSPAEIASAYRTALDRVETGNHAEGGNPPEAQ